MATPRSDHALALSNDGYVFALGGAHTNAVERIATTATGQSNVARDDNVTGTDDVSLLIAILSNDSALSLNYADLISLGHTGASQCENKS